jgi:S1-C subfamily serine protease
VTQKKDFKHSSEELEFNIVFDPIPSTTSKIDIIEDENKGGFNFFGVNLKAQSNNNTTYQNPSNIENTHPVQPSNLYEECNKIQYIPQSPRPDFPSMLAGVKHAIILDEAESGPSVIGLENYLKNIGFESITYPDIKNLDAKLPITGNPLEVVFVQAIYDFNYNYFYNIKLKFTLNEVDYIYELTTNQKVKAGDHRKNENDFYEVFRSMYGYKKQNFNSYNTVKTAKKQTCWNENIIKSDFQTKGCDNLEGIYENSSNTSDMVKYKVAVKKINSIYYLIYLSGAEINGNWKEGEIKATLEPTATSLFYKAKWLMANKKENNDFYISFENGLMNVIDNDSKSLYIKLFPTASDKTIKSSSMTSSGTGYAISSNGYIVTNHHVTEGANSIKVRGVNGDFSKTYSAKIIIEDKNNDLSIIKIEDSNFNTLGKIPYTILNKSSDVGSSVFVLGYPLRATMGDEVKLTNGIISSKSGFQGDATTYQITAPVQPGNSGGPLFDYKGNIIGIVNAKHSGAENASYAIKSSYLLNLIDIMSTPPKLQTISEVSGKPLTEQVKILKKFTYIIETN